MPRRPAPRQSVAFDDALDALFEGVVDDFIARRDALAKELRADGRREDAARVKSIRRPSVAAWAVNHVARRRRDDVARLAALGDQLRKAQDEAVARGERSSRLRDLGAQRRSLVGELADAAFDVLRDRGVASESHRDDIAATFEAVAADPDAATKVLAGRLTRALEAPIGFGASEGVVVSMGDDTTKRTPSAKPRAGGGRTPRVHVLDAAEVRKARARAARAAEAWETAEREVARLEQALTVARQEAAQARDAAARAEAAAAAAESAVSRSG
ncbi:MAG TPA: hypothetical protein VM938_14740 [Acidimicrobiales bacterium]|nr:hypothetical protein [Acidimicrobiales bacterium]